MHIFVFQTSTTVTVPKSVPPQSPLTPCTGCEGNTCNSSTDLRVAPQASLTCLSTTMPPSPLQKPTISLDMYLRRQGRNIEISVGDGNCLFRCFSYQLTRSQEEHIAVRTLVLRFQNLNKSVFQPFLTGINKPTMEQHIKHLLVPGVFGTHVEILAIATFYRVPVFYCSARANLQYAWHRVMPLGYTQREFRYPDLAGSPLDDLTPPTHFELAYKHNTHYDSCGIRFWSAV